MAIEKMVLLNLVASLEDENSILEQLIRSNRIHLDIDTRNIYDNNYIIHQYESTIPQHAICVLENYQEKQVLYKSMEDTLEVIKKALGKETSLLDGEKIEGYPLGFAKKDLDKLHYDIGEKAKTIETKSEELKELEHLKEILECIEDPSIRFSDLEHLTYFDYEVGLLSSESKIRVRKNYENISAIVTQIGAIPKVKEDIYLVLYPKEYKEETDRLLKSLNWEHIPIAKEINGSIEEILENVTQKISTCKAQIKIYEGTIHQHATTKQLLLDKIYTRIKMERKILEMKEDIMHGNNLFVLNAWIRKKDKEEVEEKIKSITSRYVMLTKEVKELDKKVSPPTKMENHWFVKPFETVVRLYGIPSYDEIDPTPFLAITFCLMFGIMFGDIGQGLVYFLAGLAFYKKNEVAGGVLTRLGASSIVFGFVYGSLFGLEHEQLHWLPSLIGSPLATKNIPLILLMGVLLGVVLLSISFFIGIFNALKNGHIEEGVFGKTGILGYVFYISLLGTLIAALGFIPIPVKVFVWLIILSLTMMILKEPLTNIVTKHTPYFHGDVGAYFVESIFEAIETILSTLSNAISFIRIGAFALNHAGLFLAFLKMSEMTESILLKIFILFLGNVLILSLEGLIVFIQGLRLQYYEMFNKYFKGDGKEYLPITLEK
jgi:V/A-type H+-transporting ATPase subunit I